MAFDGIVVAGLVHEFRNELIGGRIAKIAQPETDELLLTIKTNDGQRRLLISADASLPLIYLTDANKPAPMTAPNFCMLLRKHIGGGRIVDITSDGKIIDSIKHVSAQMSSVREVLPGREYFIPDTMHKADPLTVDADTFTGLLKEKPMPVSKAVYTSFTGISPVTAEEICHLAGLDSAIPAKEYSEDILFHLYTQFTIYLSAIKEGRFTPAIYYDGREPKEFAALPLNHFDGYECREYASISEVLSTFYSTRSLLTRIRQKSADLRHIVQTALERNRKKYDLQLRQLKDTENREKFRIYGELINAYGYNVEEDARKLDALNYYTNEMVSIPLDPTKTPQENAQRYFAKYNKQKRTFEALSELSKETLEDINYLESVQTALDIALTEEDLAQIREELAGAGYIRRRFTKKKVRIKNEPLHYISSDGYHIYVGKNNLQNEELTFHFASGNDWWFHAKQAPGSHVIVKSNGDELPDRTFEEAGRLAAYYSSMRGSDKVEIDYVQKKHVKKPNGAKPGFVVYYTNYSLVIDSDISGITSCLSN